MKTLITSKQRLLDAFERNRPGAPMTEDETMFFMHIMLSKDENLKIDLKNVNKDTELYQHFKELIGAFQVQIFLKRLELLTILRISLGALIMIALHLDNAGTAVMYAFYLHHKLPPNTLITYKEIVSVFPWGFFREEQLNDIWDAQKVHSDDGLDEWHCHGVDDYLLDYNETWDKSHN